MPNKIGVVIITYNVHEKLYRTVESIEKQVDSILIVDNNSDENTKEIIRNLSKDYNGKLEYIFNSENLGIAKALNQGIQFFENKNFDWVMTMDHDSSASLNMVEKMFNTLNKMSEVEKESIGVIGPEVFDKNLDAYTYSVEEGTSLSYRDTLIQSGTMFRLNVLKKSGCFDEELFIYYVDDDMCRKIRKAGYKIIMVRDALLYHEEGNKIYKRFLGRTLTWSGYSRTALYYIARNSIIMYKRYKKSVYLQRMLVEAIKAAMFEPAKIPSYIKGIKHGVRNKLGKYKIKE